MLFRGKNAVRRKVRRELEKVSTYAARELSRVERIMNGPTYDGIGNPWPESYSELVDDRDALRSLLSNEALWKPTNEQIDEHGSWVDVMRDLLRFVKCFCDVGELVEKIEERIAKSTGHANEKAESLRQRSPADPHRAPDSKLAALLGDPDSRSRLGWTSDQQEMTEPDAWARWSRKICKRDAMASIRVAAAVARVAEGVYRRLEDDVDDRFQNIRSCMDDWIVCPCDPHADQLAGVWNSAKDLYKGTRAGVNIGESTEAALEATDVLLTTVAFANRARRVSTWSGHRAFPTPSLKHINTMPGDAAGSCVSALSREPDCSRKEAARNLLAAVRSEVVPWALGTADPLLDNCRCSTCGAEWCAGAFSEGCAQCGGGALIRACGNCDGTCGAVWVRFVESSRESGVAAWAWGDICEAGWKKLDEEE